MYLQNICFGGFLKYKFIPPYEAIYMYKGKACTSFGLLHRPQAPAFLSMWLKLVNKAGGGSKFCTHHYNHIALY